MLQSISSLTRLAVRGEEELLYTRETNRTMLLFTEAAAGNWDCWNLNDGFNALPVSLSDVSKNSLIVGAHVHL